jgi:hypothetical protein
MGSSSASARAHVPLDLPSIWRDDVPDGYRHADHLGARSSGAVVCRSVPLLGTSPSWLCSELSPGGTISSRLTLVVPVRSQCYGILLHLTPYHPPPTPTSLLFTSPSSPTKPKPLPPALTHPPSERPTKALTIVVPAYNEALRLPVMLQELHSWLTAPERTRIEAYGAGVKDEEGWEVLVVDDGSKDGTHEVALGVGKEWEEQGWGKSKVGQGEMRVVRLGRNVGKGGAVRHVSRCCHTCTHSIPLTKLFACRTGCPPLSRSASSLRRCRRSIDVRLARAAAEGSRRDRRCCPDAHQRHPDAHHDLKRRRVEGSYRSSSKRSGCRQGGLICGSGRRHAGDGDRQ